MPATPGTAVDQVFALPRAVKPAADDNFTRTGCQHWFIRTFSAAFGAVFGHRRYGRRGRSVYVVVWHAFRLFRGLRGDERVNFGVVIRIVCCERRILAVGVI